jgi:uncharacterized protein
MNTILILPGVGNSGPEHWQTHWQRLYPSFRRVEQMEWDSPRCQDWVQRLDAVISTISENIVLVAHSSSCALVAHWTRQANSANRGKIRGALLVAPSDPDGPNYPIGPTGFAPIPLEVLPYPSIVVASTDDRYITIERAREYAEAWHSRIVIIENAGHINSASGLGDWPQGIELLKEIEE